MGIMSAIGTFFGVLFVLLFSVAVTHLLLLDLSSNEARGHEFGEGVYQFWITPTVPLADAASVARGLAVAHRAGLELEQGEALTRAQQRLARRSLLLGCAVTTLDPPGAGQNGNYGMRFQTSVLRTTSKTTIPNVFTRRLSPANVRQTIRVPMGKST